MYQLRLPIDYPRSLTQNYNYQQEIFEISTPQYQKSDNSLERFLLATWGCLIYRYHQDDTLITVGCNSCQSRDNHQSSFDLFSLILQVSSSTNFAELLDNIEKQVTENKDTEQEKRKSNVAFVDSCVVDLDSLQDQFNFDLILSVNLPNDSEKDTCQCQLIYNTNLFNSQTIERIISHFNILLNSLINDLQQPIDQLPLLTASEKHKLLYEWNQTKINYTTDKCIHQLFEEQVEKNPDAIAVIFENEQLTYRELNQKANQLANYLQTLGVSNGEFIGLFLEPSLTRIIGLLAILKIGGVYLPLDPTYPQERLKFMIEDSQISIILTEEYLNPKLSIKSLRMINLDTDWNKIEQESSHKVENKITVKNLAYIIYTSGSTGRPKGVLVDHKALSYHCQNMIVYYELNNSDRVLQFASFSFDVSLEQILPTFAVGATLILVDAKSLTPLDLNKTIIDFGLTVVNFPPVYLTQWLQVLEENKISTAINKLRLVISGGESLPLNTVKKWHRSPLQNISLINAYGPTEATITAITFLVPKDNKSVGLYHTIPIGRPLANRKTYILDTNKNPVPIGVVGELYIGGEGLACGYLNQLKLTQEKFINNPFGRGKLYKTGDLARYLTDGNIEFLGRIDNQVKLRGFRIELGEIETILTQHFYVREAKLMIREDSYNNQRLVAYIIPNSSQTSSSEMSHQIREYLKEKLPNYMIPSSLIVLEAFPLTPNGKIDYSSFPEPTFSAFQRNYLAPRTPTEEIITNIWKQILSIKNIGINDNFFELGGHSLLATQVISRIRKNLNREIPISLLFEHPTIAQLSEYIALKETSNNDLLTPPIKPRNEQDSIPLSSAQQRLWFLAQLEPNNTAYNLCYRFQIQGVLNVIALEKSLAEIRKRHEILRTNFVAINGKPTQIINNNDLDLPIIDLQPLPDVEKEIEAEKIAKEEANYTFNLSKDSLFHVKLIRLNPQECQLLFNFHHIIFDGWSFGLLFSELKSLYTAYFQGSNSQLPSLPIQYADFTLWQKNNLKREVLEPQLSYWKKQLDGTLPRLELPTDQPRPKIQTYKGATKTFIFSSELIASIKAFSKREGVTLFMTLLAAFKVLLGRYSGQKDVIVGTAIAGRKHQEIEKLMGFFVNTLALRSNLSEHFSFRELLTQIKQVCLDAYAHQDVPFEQLVERLQPERDLSHSPIFQVMFVLQNTAMDELELPNLTVTNLETSRQTAKFDITLSIEERQGKLVGEWEYNTDLFDSSTIERMSTHFQVLLSAILTNPQENIWKLPLLTDKETQQLLVEWNQNELLYPSHLCLHQLFEIQVEKTPNAIALIFDKEEISYRQINEQANQLAHYLKSLGVQPETLVGLLLHRSPIIIIAMLAILKIGGTYVPLDNQYPQKRLLFILEDCQISFLLTESSLENILDHKNENVTQIKLDKVSVNDYANYNPRNRVTPDNLAYIIYTSGSTGQPKGVAIEHHSSVALVYWAKEIFSPQELSGVLASTSICFDLSIFEIFVTLSCGGSIILVENALELPKLFYQDKVTLINTVPSIIKQLIEINGIPKNVITVTLAGETLKRKTVEKLYAINTIENVYNLYGPSEDTTYSTYELVDKEITGNPSIGRPITNTKIYILDKHLNPVPCGVFGELYIGGDGLARGYFNRSELTKQKFIDSPFDYGQKLYKTGDLAYYRKDGKIEFLGRIDNQVKIRGFRIELGEIEAILSQHSQVKEAKVISKESKDNYKQLVAYIIPSSNQNIATETYHEIRKSLKQQLPNYMIPAAFLVLDSFPLTPNGKIDYRALPEPDFSAFQSNYIAPRTPTEKIIADIWKQILKIKNIGINDNFFELGGHSLLATQVISRIRETFKQEISLRLLFEYPTISQLSEYIKSRKDINYSVSLPPIETRKQQKKHPLSFAQEGLWFLAQLEPNSTAYNMPFIFSFRGSLDIRALEKSLFEIINRHEILRTNFIAVEGIPYQVINKNIDFQLPIVDLQSLSSKQREKEAKTLAEQEVNIPFNLAKDSLIRVKLLRLNIDYHVLILNIHHIIFDGWSNNIFQQELEALYQAFSTGKSNPLSPVLIQYADFALWQQQWFKGKFLEPQLLYWKKQLGGTLPILELPTDRPRPRIQRFDGKRQSFSISSSLTQSLTTLSQQEGATLFMTTLAAFYVLLYRYSGQEDIIVGTPIAGRHHSKTESLIGFFINTLALRISIKDNPSFLDLLKQVKAVFLEAYEHQDTPFEKLVEELQPERNLSHSPIFQVMFILQNTPKFDLHLPNLTHQILDSNSSGAKFDLTVSLTEIDDYLISNWTYNTDLFDSSTITRMTGHFQTLLENIVANPSAAIAKLPLLTDNEKQQMLVEWNRTDSFYPKNACIHHLFESVAAEKPDALAVVCGEEKLTYQQLNLRANQLAHYLQKLGVGPEVIVGIGVERSPDMIVSIMGIFKAGGAYVPVDPALPKARLTYMLKDTGTKVLLTQRHLEQNFQDFQGTVVYLEEDWSNIAQENSLNPTVNVKSENLAYVIYTSGSTGQPKGVMVEHHSLCGFAAPARLETYCVNCNSRVLLFGSLSFSTSLSEIFMTFMAGASLYITQPNDLLVGSTLAYWLREYKITHIKTTPSVLATIPDVNFPWLSVITVVGEASSAEVLERWRPHCTLLNSYGATEVSVSGACGQYQESLTKPSIGHPLANTQIYLLNHHQQPVPINVPGEIYIGGAGVARGYINQPNLTAQRFINNPFKHKTPERIYKTGDLGVYLSDGKLVHLGRLDNQVKIRGFRIELGEIETILGQHPSLQKVVVIAREDELDYKRLVAYVVPRKNQVFSLQEMRVFLADKLPNYMIPTAVVVLDVLPLTVNGKINRLALPAPDYSTFITDNSLLNNSPLTTFDNIRRHILSLEPFSRLLALQKKTENTLESRLLQIWKKTLNINSVNINDDFFDLGGHSLLSIRLLAKIEQEFSIDIPLSTFLQNPTITALVNFINEPRNISLESSVVPVQTQGKKIPLFFVNSISYAQKFGSYLEKDQPFYILNIFGITEFLNPKLDSLTLEDIANKFVEDMETVCANNCYYLMTYCGDFSLTLEIIKQLQKKGRTIPQVFLIDSFWEPEDLGIYLYWYNLRQFGVGYFFEKVKSKFRYQKEELIIFLKQIICELSSINKKFLPRYIKDIKLLQALTLAKSQYYPQPSQVKVILFLSQEYRLLHTSNLANFFKDNIEVHEIPGYHHTLFQEPYIQVLVKKLNSYLEVYPSDE